MRMISERDEKIISELGAHVHNDMDLISRTLHEVAQRSRSLGRNLSMLEAIEIAKRLQREDAQDEAA